MSIDTSLTEVDSYELNKQKLLFSCIKQTAAIPVDVTEIEKHEPGDESEQDINDHFDINKFNQLKAKISNAEIILKITKNELNITKKSLIDESKKYTEIQKKTANFSQTKMVNILHQTQTWKQYYRE